jgi:hypothetical protein
MLRRKQLPVLNILTIVIILASATVTLTEVGNIVSAQGQGNLTAGNITLTPEQKAAMCDPNNPKLKIVNTTESKICGIPSNTTSTAANTTMGTEAPPATSAVPSVTPPS